MLEQNILTAAHKYSGASRTVPGSMVTQPGSICGIESKSCIRTAFRAALFLRGMAHVAEIPPFHNVGLTKRLAEALNNIYSKPHKVPTASQTVRPMVCFFVQRSPQGFGYPDIEQRGAPPVNGAQNMNNLNYACALKTRATDAVEYVCGFMSGWDKGIPSTRMGNYGGRHQTCAFRTVRRIAHRLERIRKKCH